MVGKPLVFHVALQRLATAPRIADPTTGQLDLGPLPGTVGVLPAAEGAGRSPYSAGVLEVGGEAGSRQVVR